MTPNGAEERLFARDDIERSLVARLARMVEVHGHRMALRDEQVEVTYRELGVRVTAVANAVLSARPDDGAPVALVLDHSAETVVALLGVIAAGHPYVPLDPAYPREHLQRMISHSGAKVVLTSQSHLALCRALKPEGTILDLAAISDNARVDLSRLAALSTADSAACILYTSGSTGTPKGIVHTHRTIQHLIWSHVESYGLGPEDRLALVFSASFAASLSEIFGAMLSGACLSLTSAKRTGNLAAWVRDQGITAFKLPVSLFRVFLRSLVPSDVFPTTRLVLLGGDALFRKDVEIFRAHFPKYSVLVNRLTSTESLSITRYPIDLGLPLGEHVVPVGYADHDTEVEILGEDGHPVPAGELGQIAVRSRYLSPGYWHQDDLTRATFSPGPPGDARVTLRTGDLGRLAADGCLTHFGRRDQQVKVRGHRIELSVVEAALSALDAVKEAAAVVHNDEGEGEGKRLVGYVVPADGQVLTAGTLRSALSRTLPDAMVPSLFVVLDRLPTTATGKIDRRALPAPDKARPLLDSAFAPARTSVERQVSEIWAAVLGLTIVGVNDNFFDLGGDSLNVLRVDARLREVFGMDVPVVELFAHPTIAALAGYLARARANPQVDDRSTESVSPLPRDPTHDIAIIGMAGVFPGARNLEEYWANLRAGVESIHTLSEAELIEAGVSAAQLADPAYVRTVPAQPELRRFDADFFGLSPSEAAILDPQHRLLLETAWHALEAAGCVPDKFPGRIGVFAGATQSAYLQQHLLPQREMLSSVSDVQLRLACDPEFLATRIAYKFNLKGPAVTVGTACSTSLVAVHLACRSLREGECDVALAGGASVESPEACGYRYQDGWITSRDGHCRPFDDSAQGTVFGSGAGVVVLKRLVDALADGDTISAVIRGSAINNDGALKVGFAAPSLEGQVAVISAAQKDAGIAGGAIDYVETHGTGTALGDPIEIGALARAFDGAGAAPGSVAIGSVKANIGHLSRAAGIAGLIKTVLALEHGELPPSLNFEQPNRQIDFARGPFFVNKTLRPWKPSVYRVRRAAVSSFGVGGTNAHVIIEEAPEVTAAAVAKPWQVLTLSARTPSALATASAALRDDLVRSSPTELADVAWTLQTGRADFAVRRAVVCKDRADALAKIAQASVSSIQGSTPTVVFMFPGQGAQYAGMTAGLYQDEPTFRADIDLCADLLAPELGLDLRKILYPSDGEREQAASLLAQTHLTQPALFVTEWAVGRLLMRWGIRPDAMVGHSIGEHAAACLAGVMSVEDTLPLIARRGKLIQALPPGRMLVVHLPEREVAAFCDDKISLAAVNAPNLCVVAGCEADISDLAQRLAAKSIDHHLLRTSHAFHSWMMDPALADFTAEMSRHERRPPQIPYLSGVTGIWITPAQAMAPDYWSRLLRGTVRFSDGLRTLGDLRNTILVEVGPGRSLTTLARQHAGLALLATVSLVRSASEARGDRQVLLEALGELWSHGAPIDWKAVHGDQPRRRVRLPGYPFERREHWVPRPRGHVTVHSVQPGQEPQASVDVSVSAPISLSRPSPWLDRLGSTADGERPALLRDYLRQTINDLLGLESSRPVEADRPLVDLGVDSLSSIQLGERVARDLRVALPVREILAGNLESLGSSLAGLLDSHGVPKRESARTRILSSLTRDLGRPLVLGQSRAWTAGDILGLAERLRLLFLDGAGPLGIAFSQPGHVLAALVAAWGAHRRSILIDPSLKREADVLQRNYPGIPIYTDKASASSDPSSAGRVVVEEFLSTPTPATTVPTWLTLPTDDEPFAVLLTSASTGENKVIEKRGFQIYRQAQGLMSALNLPASSRVLSFVPPYHLLGFFYGLVLPLVLGGETIVATELAGAAMAELLVKYHPDLVVGTATHYRFLVRASAKPSVPPSATVYLSSGAPLDPAVAEAFASKYGTAVRDFYGSTELGGVAFRAWPEPYRAMPGVRWRIDPETASLDIMSPWSGGSEGAWLATDDAAEPVGQSVFQDSFEAGFRLLGRLDHVVKVGGKRFSTVEVEQSLHAMSAVAESAVFPYMRFGEPAIAAVLAPEPGHALDEAAVRAFLASRLAAYKVPRTILVLEKLPRGSHDKIDYLALRALVAGEPFPGKSKG